MKRRFLIRRMIAACGLWWAAGSGFAQGPAATPANVASPANAAAVAAKNVPDAPFLLREVWVPADALDPVLARYPRAVPLNRDQLLTLLHDARAADPAAADPAHVPPEHAVLRQARFEGRLAPGPDGGQQVRVEGLLEVESLSDAWADVPLGLPGIALGTAELDDVALGRAALRRSDGSGGSEAPARLQLQGRGVHRLRLGFVLPVAGGVEGSVVNLPQVDGVGEFTLHLPAGTRLDSQRGCAVQAEEGGGVAARVPLGHAPGKPFSFSNDIGDFTRLGSLKTTPAPAAPVSDRLRWRTPPPAPPETAAMLQEGRVDATVEGSRVTVRQAVVLRPALGKLPGEARLALPAGARAVQVENAAGRWDVGGDGLRVALLPVDGAAAFTVRYDLPLSLDGRGTVARVGVPWLEVAGAHRVTGSLDVSRGPGVQVRRIEPGAVTAPAAGENVGREGFVASFTLADLPAPGNAAPPTALTLEARRTTARFTVDADVRADFRLDGVHVQRTLAFRVEEGEVFAARVRLPPGETLLDVHPTAGSAAPDWRQEGGELVLAWNAGLAETSKTALVLDTRADLAPPKPGAPTVFTLGAALVPGAERLAGYVALVSAPALRLVTTGGEETLERRDGRTTPVPGSVAWFYREGFRLALRVERRAAQTEARFTGYALPLAGAVEIHAQIDYHFLFSGVETVKIRVPRESADAFFFTGPNIAERRRDDDVWTIRFQGEQGGDYALGIQATIPAPADRDDAQRFHFRLPAIVPLDGARWAGAWAVEANTDTEIRFTAAGANEADTLHAPPLAGYQPTRRVIGVFEFTGGGAADAAIDLDGVRHPAAVVAAAVVDRLELETFASASGVSRHRAALRARTAGDGFFDLRLPPDATLWSLTRDGEPVKPVGGNGAATGVVRVELPGGRAPADASTVVAVYETPGQPWTRTGRWAMAAPGFAPGVPVVRSSWKLHLPEGFDYRFPAPPHGAAPAAAAPGDLLVPRLGIAAMNIALLPFPVFSSVQVAGRGRTSPILNDARVETDTDMPAAAATPAVTSSATFIDKVAQVKDLLTQAQGFYDSGRYDLAFKRYAQVLNLDPYNDAARKGQERIDLRRGRSANATPTDETRGRDGLQYPVNHREGAEARRRLPGLRDDAATPALQRKLAAIIIPTMAFQSTTLGDAIESLRRESQRLDTDSDPNAHGVDIFLKLPAGSTASDARITLTINHISLLEAIRYVASQAGLGVKVEPYAVSLVPLSEQTDVMVTKDFKVPSNFFSNQNDGPAAPSGRVDAKKFLEASGVTFPPGASATYLPETGKLVARNTQENLDLIESLTGENVAPTSQAAQASPPVLTILPSDAKADGSLVTAELGNTPPGLVGDSPRNGATGSGGAMDTTGVGTVTIARQDAKTFLEAQGMTFPPGASATYLASSGKLVVRNTKENLDRLAKITGASQPGTSGMTANAIDALMFGTSAGKNTPPGTSFPFQPRVGRENARTSGLLPLKLDLPDNGQLYTFAGGGEPGTVELRYTDRRTAARGRWVCLTLGALGFLVLAAGWAHPWRRTFYAVLALSFLPLIAVPSALTACNALLSGWLWAVLGWGVTRFLLRRRPPVVVAVVWLCLGAWQIPRAHAAPESTPPPQPLPPEMVIVPYDATKPVTGQQPLKYYLPYERFLTLWDAAKLHRRPPMPEPPPGGASFTLGASRYDARLTGDNALEIAASIDFQTAGDGWVAVPVTFEGMSIAAVTLDGASAALSGDGKLWIGTPGAHRLTASLHRRVANFSPGTSVSWNVPPATATLLTLALPRASGRVEVHGNQAGGGVVEEPAPDGERRLTASLGGASDITLTFREALPPAAASGQPALARVETRLTAGTRAETVHADVNLSFFGGAQDHFTVFLDHSLTLTGLDAPDVKTWRLDTGGDRQTLDLTLNAPARDAYHVALAADRPLPALPAGRRAFPAVTARAARVETVAALRTDGAVELTLADGPPADARRVPDPSPAPGEGRPFAAFEGGGVGGLVYNVRAADEKRTAHIDYLYQVGRGKIDLAAQVRLVPAAGGGPVSSADFRLPPGFAVQAVAGAAVQQWWRDGDVLSVRLGAVAAGAEVPLLVYLVRQFDRAPERFALQPLVAGGFAATDGEVVVAADRAVTVGLTLPTGARASDLSEIDPATAAKEFQVKPPLERQRAFRYRGAAFNEVAAALETQAPRWQAQWVTRATVREGVVALETHVNVAARQGAADALEFSLPAGLPEARVSGPDVRETLTVESGDKARRTYRVLFQNPVYAGGELAFVLNQELPLGADGRAALPDLAFPEAGGGRAAGGFLLVENASDGEMTLDPHGLDPAIEKDVPFLPPQIVAGTRFFRAAPNVPWSLGVRVAALEKTAGRAALVSYAELTSTLRAGGEEWHRAVYHLQNRRLQFLPVELPAGTEFIGARVAGESVRVDAGKVEGNAGGPALLVPLLKTRPGELSYDVELVYRRPAPGGGKRGRRDAFFEHWQMDDPRLPGVAIEKTLWNVWLPEDMRLLNSGGNVEPVLAILNETEKYESALSDLRSLSATYASAGASQSERQRALSNFQSLASTVTRGAALSLSGRIEEGEDQGALLKQFNFAGQSFAVGEKKKEIRREIDSLNSVNLRSQQTQQGQGMEKGDIHDQRASGTASFDGFINYGSPIQTTSTANATPLPPHVVDLPIFDKGWRDNRPADQQKPTGAIAGGFVTTISGQSVTAPMESAKGQLALNDSLAVDMEVGRDAVFKGASVINGGTLQITPDQNRLSTARARYGFAESSEPMPALPASATTTPIQKARRESPPAAPRDVTGLVQAAAPAAPAPSDDMRPESLRSVGRISLAVDFPQEGQVFHFKKLKADARLTLWSARPERFAALGWLALVGWVLLLVWASSRRQRARRVTAASGL